jgi:asparagine synthase (glutamine-hydrolysing)
VVQIGGTPRPVVPPNVLDRMTDVMTHRGPNDRGTHEANGVALGVRRLSIVDVAGGHQPFSNEDRTVWAVQNGELYEHDKLRSRLAWLGHRFTSRCDTEVLPHLYEDVGERFVELLRGKFGIAVWDERARRAVVARDRLGIKPLYYAHVDDLVVFGSELKSLLASGLVGTELDYEAIDSYLTLGFFPGPRTPLRQVAKLPPGRRLVVDPDGLRVEEYWSYPEPDPDKLTSADEHAERLLAELDEAVRLRLMSDVPLGAMLSGGLDSSLVVGLMARHSSEPVKTFSVGFAGIAEGNELAHARAVARHFATDHHELELSLDDNVGLDDLVWHLDEPVADLSTLGFFALSRLASRHVTVALSGQGADELFGGYRKHRAAAIAGAWRRLPGFLQSAGGALVPLAPARFDRAGRTLTAGNPVERLLAMSGRLDGGTRTRLVRGPLAALDGESAQRAVSARLNGLEDNPLSAALYLDAQLALVDSMLHYFDRTSMAHSLEVRVPFLDHKVVEYAARIPAELKVRRLETKHVLRRAAAGVVPAEILERKKVGFFHAVAQDWFRRQLDGAVARYLTDTGPRYADFLDPAEVAGLVAAQRRSPDRNRGILLLGIVMLEAWLQTYVARATPSTARA